MLSILESFLILSITISLESILVIELVIQKNFPSQTS